MPRSNRPHITPGKQAYRVRATVYPSGRVFKRVVPANSEAEAEQQMRAYLKYKVPQQQGGYNFQTKKVANYYGERD